MAVTRIKSYHGTGAAVVNSLAYITNEGKTVLKLDDNANNAFKYAANPDKTTYKEQDEFEQSQCTHAIPQYTGDIVSGQELVTGYMCDPEMAAKQFQLTMDQYYQSHDEHLSYQTAKRIFRAKLDETGKPLLDNDGKMIYDSKAPVYHDKTGKCIYETYKKQTKARTAYMWVLSFPPDRVCGYKIDPRICHQIGLEFIKKIGNGEYQAVVATHMDREHPHDHIVMCAYSKDGTHKYRDTLDSLKDARIICDDLSLKFGLPILPSISQEQSKTISWSEWKAKQEGQSWKEQMRQDINGAIRIASGYDQFIEIMQSSGYKLRETSGHLTYIMPGEDEFRCRDCKLGKEYEKSSIKEYLDNKHNLSPKRQNDYEDKSLDIDGTDSPKEIPKKMHIRVSRYTFGGRRRSDIEMIFLTAIMLIRELRNKLRTDEKEDKEKTSVYKDYSWTLEQMVESLRLIRQLGIEDYDQLDTALNETGTKLSIAKREAGDLELTASYNKKVLNLIDEAEQYMESANNIGFDLSWLYLNKLDKRRIKENIARENPARPSQRRELYLLLQKYSEQYRLGCKYDDLSSRDANEIIIFLQGKSDTIPDELFYSNERPYYHSHSSVDVSTSNNKENDTLFENRLLDYDPHTQQMLSGLRYTLQALSDLGIEKESFSQEKKRIQHELESLDDKLRDINQLKQQYKNLKRVQYSYKLATSPALKKNGSIKEDKEHRAPIADLGVCTSADNIIEL